MDIYIINLASDTKRKVAMQSQIDSIKDTNKSHFNIIFFNATNARENEHLAFSQYDKMKALMCRGRELSAGERGCFASHYRLWELCIAQNAPIVVLEDDVILDSSFFSTLALLESSAYSYIRLMFLKPTAPCYKLDSICYLSLSVKLSGTQGYYITPCAARAFMDKAQKWYAPLDDYMDMFFIHNVPSVCIKPIIEDGGALESSIESIAKGRWQKPNICLKIMRECARIYSQFKCAIYKAFYLKRLILPQSCNLEQILKQDITMLERNTNLAKSYHAK